jgi:hypothetical protein
MLEKHKICFSLYIYIYVNIFETTLLHNGGFWQMFILFEHHEKPGKHGVWMDMGMSHNAHYLVNPNKTRCEALVSQRWNIIGA